jgi:hypothetical protein
MNYEHKNDNTFYPSSLTDEWSPNLPKNFPKTRIPGIVKKLFNLENICEKEFINLLKCGLHFGYAM